jgi:type IV pilus assembly protein PilP
MTGGTVNARTHSSSARRGRALAAVGILLVAGTALAAPQAAPPAVPPAAAPAAAPRSTPVLPQGYTYNPEGRRDPFVSLINRGTDQKSQTPRPEGLPGVSVSDVAIRGIVVNNKAYIAMVQAPDGKTYIVRNGDRLYDATVKAVLADAVVFVQQVNDPLSLVKQREIRKPLRPTEEGK